MRLQHHLRILHRIFDYVSQNQGYKIEQTYSWVGQNKLPAKARASVVFASFAIAFVEIVDECLCWYSIGFWSKWQEQEGRVQCLG